jgi:cyanate permease
MGMSLLMFWHHLGEFVGPLYFGKIFDLTGQWAASGGAMVPVCVVGAIVCFLLKIEHSTS